MKTTIKSASFADYDDNLRTIRVVASSEEREITLDVQTNDGRYRGDLGCWIMNDDTGEQIDLDDYEDFDIDAIIKAAEEFLTSTTLFVPVHEKTGVYIRITNNALFEIVEENKDFINPESSNGMSRFFVLGTAKSYEEAHKIVSDLAER